MFEKIEVKNQRLKKLISSDNNVQRSNKKIALKRASEHATNILHSSETSGSLFKEKCLKKLIKSKIIIKTGKFKTSES